MPHIEVEIVGDSFAFVFILLNIPELTSECSHQLSLSEIDLKFIN